MKKKFLKLVVLLVIVAVGFGLWKIRPAAAPSEDITNNIEGVSASEDQIIFRIDSENSNVEFNIFEVLAGEDFTVIGTTNQVAGEAAINLQNLEDSQVGMVKINARTLATDSEFRDNAIKNEILLTNEFEFIEFKVNEIKITDKTAFLGMAGVPLELNGDLKLKNKSLPIKFNVVAQLNPLGELSIKGETTIKHEEFELEIPEVPFVANVADDVILKVNLSLVSEENAETLPVNTGAEPALDEVIIEDTVKSNVTQPIINELELIETTKEDTPSAPSYY